MISCKRATELISKSLEDSLSLKDEVLLKMHLFICETCELFRKQSHVLRKAVRASETALLEGSKDEPPVDPSAKERIQKKLDEELDRDS